MANDEIKKLLESSIKVIEQNHESFVKTIKDDLQNFKKITLDKI